MKLEENYTIVVTIDNNGCDSRFIENLLHFNMAIFLISNNLIEKNLLEISPVIKELYFPQNNGKGALLKSSFKELTRLGFTHAITIDSHNGNSTEDIFAIINSSKENSSSLIIGSRTKPIEPAKISPIRKFARVTCNFWTNLYTGLKLKDVRSSLRVYPISLLEKINFKRDNLDFEQEVIMKSSWQEIPIIEVEIADTLISRKRYFLDYFREIIQLTTLNIIAFFSRFINPFKGSEVPGDNFREKTVNLVKHELKSHATPLKASISVSLGVFMGIAPIHGFQVVSLMFLATAFKLNRPLAFLGVNISMPPLLPFIIWGAVKIGSIFLGEPDVMPEGAEAIIAGLLQFFVGSIILAPILAMVTFTITYPIFQRIYKEPKS